jgi:hypothetical protein
MPKAVFAAGHPNGPGRPADARASIQLHVDLTSIRPKRRRCSRISDDLPPAASNSRDIADVGMLKLRSTLMGKAPPASITGSHSRFKRGHRQKWIASDVHQKVWPTIENLLSTKDYTVMLFDAI